MRKYDVLITCDTTMSATVRVEAESADEAEAQAVLSQNADGAAWEQDDGNVPEPYIAAPGESATLVEINEQGAVANFYAFALLMIDRLEANNGEGEECENILDAMDQADDAARCLGISPRFSKGGEDHDSRLSTYEDAALYYCQSNAIGLMDFGSDPDGSDSRAPGWYFETGSGAPWTRDGEYDGAYETEGKAAIAAYEAREQ